MNRQGNHGLLQLPSLFRLAFIQFIMQDLTLLFVLGIIIVAYITLGTVIVRQNSAVIIERLGKYQATLEAGIHLIIPLVDRSAYLHSLKETAIDIFKQQAITKDNVGLTIDGVLYYKIVDPKVASYGIDRLQFAITQLAQTTMRAEIGRLALDETFESREAINANITASIDEASAAWGTKITRYEIKDISPPETIKEEMEKQMAAERERRAEVLRSEGYRQSQINQAEGDRQSLILRAEGRAKAVVVEATARAESIRMLGKAIDQDGGIAGVSQLLSEKYIEAFNNLAREGTMAIIPADTGDVSSMVVKGFSAFQSASTALSAGSRGTKSKSS